MDALVDLATMQMTVPIWGFVSFVGMVATVVATVVWHARKTLDTTVNTVQANIAQNNKNHRYMIAYLKLQVCLARQHLDAIKDPRKFEYDDSCDVEFLETLENIGRA